MTSISLGGNWIWNGSGVGEKNAYHYFSKRFLLSAVPQVATIRLSADSRYVLYVNGEEVGRGPARSDRRWQCVDAWDVSALCRKGENIIAVLVHHYGEWTFAYMLGRGGLIAEMDMRFGDGTRLSFGTDGSWRTRSADAWSRDVPRMDLQLGFPEVYDARKEPPGWNIDPGDDWEPATVLGPAGMEPWPRLVPRDIPSMKEEEVRPARIIASGDVGEAVMGHYINLTKLIWSPSHGVAYLAASLWSPHAMETEIHAGSQDAIRLWLNGELCISQCVERDPAPDQEIVRVRLSAGWNSLLAKIVQGEGQWHFYLRCEGSEAPLLKWSDTASGSEPAVNSTAPWRVVGPFASSGLTGGFATPYPPELHMNFSDRYPQSGGQELVWRSAGDTAERPIPSVVMGREKRLPGRGSGAENLPGLLGPGPPAVFPAGGGAGRYVVIDFGKEVNGYPVIDIEKAAGGETLDIGYAEVLQKPSGDVVSPASGDEGLVNPDRCGVHYADRYICRPGKQRFRTFEKRAFRYLQMDIRDQGEALRLGPVSLISSGYPVERRGSFSCSDPLLTRIWETSAETLRLTMEDAYIDCPWRERGQWWGDALIQARTNYYAFGDTALIRRGLRLIAQSQSADGLTRGVSPTDWPDAVLPTYTLLWVISLGEYFEYTGDRELVASLLPAVSGALSWFERFRGVHDLLRDVPGWLFVDWADVPTSGESTAVNALYHGALTTAAALERLAGSPAAGDAYSAKAETLRARMREFFWDDTSGSFRDAWSPADSGNGAGEHANCWSVVFGGCSRGETDRVAVALFVNGQVRVRSATPYFSAFVLETMARGGMHEKALNEIRTRWGAMLAWGATTWWEYWEPRGSLCHGWSTAPGSFLPAEILGVKPGAPGWESIVIEPHPAGLVWAKGEVPTPRGEIDVAWEAGDAFVLRLVVPAPCEVILPADRDEEVQVTGGDGSVARHKMDLVPSSGRRRIRIPEPGEYRINAR
jgi:hypothetical protein